MLFTQFINAEVLEAGWYFFPGVVVCKQGTQISYRISNGQCLGWVKRHPGVSPDVHCSTDISEHPPQPSLDMMSIALEFGQVQVSGGDEQNIFGHIKQGLKENCELN